MKKIISLILAVLILVTSFSTFAGAEAAKSKVKVEPGKIEKLEENLSIKVIYPYLSGFSTAAKLNETIRNKNISNIGNFNNYYKELKEELKNAGEEMSPIGFSLESYFDYNISGSLLSLIISTYEYTGGAHGMSYVESYNVNTGTGATLTFDSLFKNSNYKKIILQKIYKLIDKEKELYFDDAKKTVAALNSNYQFYIDGNKLVIYFGLYELRPYAGGMPVFEINARELKGYLKDDIYSQMINAKPLEKVRFNGTSLKPQVNTYEQSYSLMVPLQSIAKLLGYKVTWHATKGWGVAGGYLKNNVNSYYSDKSEKVKLDLPPKAKGNTLYVPNTYFSEVLKEDVFYDGKALRIFKINSTQQKMFDQLIGDFVSPGSAEESVKEYAQAVQKRNGAVQYALMSEALKAKNRAAFEELNWVTGVSSPWVTSYDIKKADNGKYDIVFHWATSAGNAGDSTTQLTVAQIKGTEYWEITGSKELEQ
ncbi:MAG: copper amine oxidase family protein [Eubacterium sp.]|nr:copper amine oxidase family protein [Eubacterium sp.]